MDKSKDGVRLISDLHDIFNRLDDEINSKSKVLKDYESKIDKENQQIIWVGIQEIVNEILVKFNHSVAPIRSIFIENISKNIV